MPVDVDEPALFSFEVDAGLAPESEAADPDPEEAPSDDLEPGKPPSDDFEADELDELVEDEAAARESVL